MQAGSGSRELLAVALEKVRSQINAVKGVKRPISEQDTKGSMIEPILASLGWDTSNLDEVRREYRHNPKDLPVDYAFFSQGKPIMFLEAKSIGHGIDDHKWMAQIVNYANSAGVEICVLTNGDEYRVFNTHAKVPLQEKLIAKASIVEDSPDRSFSILECLSRIALLEQKIISRWNREQLENRVRSAVEVLVKDKRLVNILAADLKGKLTPQQVRDTLSGASLQIQFSAGSGLGKHPTLRKPKLPASKDIGHKTGRKTPEKYAVSLADLINGGVIDTPLEVESKYYDKVLKAVINSDASVTFAGRTCSSLSVAGGYARNSVIGPPPDKRLYYQTNGWTFWTTKDKDSGKPVTLAQLRSKYLKNLAGKAAKTKLSVVAK